MFVPPKEVGFASSCRHDGKYGREDKQKVNTKGQAAIRGNEKHCGCFRTGMEGKMLQIKNLTISHKKDLRVMLEDFQFTLNAGDKAVLIGEEGNGKSTLLKWVYDPESVSGYAEAQGERICTGE